jgi:hypothetical protein
LFAAACERPAEAGPSFSIQAAEPAPDAAVLAPPAELVAEPAAAPPVEPPIPEAPRTVLLVGDSLAATGFGALLERRLDEHPLVKCHRRGKSASGLARPDFFDWMAEAKRQVDARDPDLVVVILGGNDGQDLTTRKGTGKRARWDTPGWAPEYRARVDAFLAALAAEGREILWLGLPTMGQRGLERKLERIRAVQLEAVIAAGATHLDTRELLVDEQGEALREVAVGRRRHPLREEDGVHFTMAGSEHFAALVYPRVLNALGVSPVDG